MPSITYWELIFCLIHFIQTTENTFVATPLGGPRVDRALGPWGFVKGRFQVRIDGKESALLGSVVAWSDA